MSDHRECVVLILLLVKSFQSTRSCVIAILHEAGKVERSAIALVDVRRHENSWTANSMGAFPTQARHLIDRVHLVELQHCQFHLLALVLELSGRREGHHHHHHHHAHSRHGVCTEPL